MEFTLSIRFKAKPEEVYSSWLNSEKHTEMTGGSASISNQVGSAFTTWDGYIEGINLELEPSRRILQSWRTSEFASSEADSQIEILLKEEE